MAGYTNLSSQEQTELARELERQYARIPEGATYYEVTCCGDVYNRTTDKAEALQWVAQGQLLAEVAKLTGSAERHVIDYTTRVKGQEDAA